MTKRQFLVILYLLVRNYPTNSTDFHRTEKRTYPVSADGNKYVVSGLPLSVICKM